ncbi:hypothetical protein CRYUN_Cryun13aG0073500 [Craigia yunnanensis]
MSMKILMHLDNPADLIRVCLVSSSWRQFVIANGLCKQLCLKLLPEISAVAHTIEMNNLIDPVKLKQHAGFELQCLRRNQRVYAFLARALSPFTRKDCLSEAISASSTDNYPEESVHDTLEPQNRIENSAIEHYVCISAYFQYGFPIYSCKELHSDTRDSSTSSHHLADNKFIWTYISPEFPMAHENCLQKFKLHCIGGFLQVKLLGRVQRQEMDGLYYICISHVQIVVRPLLPRFDIEILDAAGRGTRGWEQMILNTLLRAGAAGAKDERDEPPASP